MHTGSAGRELRAAVEAVLLRMSAATIHVLDVAERTLRHAGGEDRRVVELTDR